MDQKYGRIDCIKVAHTPMNPPLFSNLMHPCFLFRYFNWNPIIMSEIWSMACFCLWYSSSPFWGLIVPQFAPNRRLITEYRLDWNKLMAIISHKSESIPSLSQKDAKPISKNKTTISKTFIFICEIIFNVLIGKKFVECNYWCI